MTVIRLSWPANHDTLLCSKGIPGQSWYDDGSDFGHGHLCSQDLPFGHSTSQAPFSYTGHCSMQNHRRTAETL